MAAVAPVQVQSELQAEEYALHPRATRVNKGRVEQNSTISNKPKSSVEDIQMNGIDGRSDQEKDGESEEEDVEKINRIKEDILNGSLRASEDDDFQYSEFAVEPSNSRKGKGKARTTGKAGAFVEDNHEQQDDQDRSDDDAGSAISEVIEEWQDASASVVAGSVADVATRNNCV